MNENPLIKKFIFQTNKMDHVIAVQLAVPLCFGSVLVLFISYLKEIPFCLLMLVLEQLLYY
jgi:hypothetical protein